MTSYILLYVTVFLSFNLIIFPSFVICIEFFHGVEVFPFLPMNLIWGMLGFLPNLCPESITFWANLEFYGFMFSASTPGPGLCTIPTITNITAAHRIIFSKLFITCPLLSRPCQYAKKSPLRRCLFGLGCPPGSNPILIALSENTSRSS
jgi:hypothetical protein